MNEGQRRFLKRVENPFVAMAICCNNYNDEVIEASPEPRRMILQRAVSDSLMAIEGAIEHYVDRCDYTYPLGVVWNENSSLQLDEILKLKIVREVENFLEITLGWMPYLMYELIMAKIGVVSSRQANCSEGGGSEV